MGGAERHAQSVDVGLLLDQSWDALQTSSLFKKWAYANPAEKLAIESYLVNGGTIPPLQTQFGKALSFEAQARRALIVQPPPPPVTTGLPQYGISLGGIALSWTDSTTDFAVKRCQELAQGHPFAFRLDGVNSGQVDKLVRAAQAVGLTPYLGLYGTTGQRAPDTLGQMLASRYKGSTPRVVFTGPNEPDLHGWTPDNVADFQKAIYVSVKTGDPKALCGYAALWKGNPNSYSNFIPYVKSACARAKGFFDFFPFHGYDDPTVHASWNIWDWWYPGGTIAADHTASEILKAAFTVPPPIISDECGCKTNDGAQAQKVVNLLTQAKNGRVAGVYIFSLLRDYDPDWYLINDDHSLRPAFSAYKTFMAGVA